MDAHGVTLAFLTTACLFLTVTAAPLTVVYSSESYGTPTSWGSCVVADFPASGGTCLYCPYSESPYKPYLTVTASRMYNPEFLNIIVQVQDQCSSALESFNCNDSPMATHYFPPILYGLGNTVSYWICNDDICPGSSQNPNCPPPPPTATTASTTTVAVSTTVASTTRAASTSRATTAAVSMSTVAASTVAASTSTVAASTVAASTSTVAASTTAVAASTVAASTSTVALSTTAYTSTTILSTQLTTISSVASTAESSAATSAASSTLAAAIGSSATQATSQDTAATTSATGATQQTSSAASGATSSTGTLASSSGATTSADRLIVESSLIIEDSWMAPSDVVYTSNASILIVTGVATLGSSKAVLEKGATAIDADQSDVTAERRVLVRASGGVVGEYVSVEMSDARKKDKDGRCYRYEAMGQDNNYGELSVVIVKMPTACETPAASTLWIVLGVMLGILALMVIAWGILWFRRHSLSTIELSAQAVHEDM